MKKRKLYLFGAVFIAVLAVGLLALGFQWLSSSRDSQNRASSSRRTNSVAQKDSKPKKEDGEGLVKLPGAEAIPIVSGDKTSPSHLWVLVNKQHPLADASYRPADLVIPAVDVNKDKSSDEQSVSGRIRPDLEAMFSAAKAAGLSLMVASGFRSAELQNQYLTSYSRVYGEDEAIKFSARPGQSEHQTGLAVDISTVDRACYLDTCFSDTPAGKWLEMNAHEYGFILRYPSDKTDITSYQFEPWHFRYVGKPLAGAIYSSKLTLEESYQYIK